MIHFWKAGCAPNTQSGNEESPLLFLRLACLASLLWLPGVQAAPTTLKLLTWSEYIDTSIVTEFEQQFGASVQLTYFDSDTDRDQMLLASLGSGFDLTMLNGPSLDAYAKRGWIAPVDADAIPNRRHIDAQWSTATR